MSKIKTLESSGRIVLGENMHFDEGTRVKDLQKENRTLQEDMRKIQNELIVLRKEHDESSKRATMAQSKLTVGIREKTALEIKYNKLRSMLNDQDVRLFFAKQMSEREARRKMEKENQCIKAEECKVRSKLQELEEFLVRNESERAEKDMAHQERMEHAQHELQAASLTMSEQVDALVAEKTVLLENIASTTSRATLAEEKAALLETAMHEASDNHKQATLALEAQLDALTTQLHTAEATVVAKETELANYISQTAAAQTSAQEHFFAAQEQLRAKCNEAEEQRAALQCALNNATTAQYLAEDRSRLVTMEFDELKHELIRLNHENSQLTATATEQSTNSTDLHNQLSAHHEQIAQVAAECASLQAQLTTATNDVQEYKTAIAVQQEGFLAEKKQLDAALLSAQEEIANNLAYYQANTNATAQMHEQTMAILKQEAKEAVDNAIKEQQAQACEGQRILNEQLVLLASQLESTINNSEMIAQRLKEKQQRISELETRLAESAHVNQEVEQYQAQLETVKEAVTTMMQDHSNEVNTLTVSLAKQKQANAELEEKLQEKIDQISILDEQLASLASMTEQQTLENSSLRLAIKESETNNSASASALVLRAESAESTASQCMMQLEKAKQQISEMEAKANDHEQCGKLVAERDNEIVTLSARLLQLEARIDVERKTAEARIQEIGHSLSETAKEALNEMQRADTFQRERDMLQNEVARLERLGQITRDENDQLGEELDTLRERLSAVPKDLSLQNASLLAERNTLKAELDLLQRKSDELNDLSAQMAGHQNAKQRIHYVEQLKRDNAEMKKRLIELQGHATI